MSKPGQGYKKSQPPDTLQQPVDNMLNNHNPAKARQPGNMRRFPGHCLLCGHPTRPKQHYCREHEWAAG